MNTRLRCFVGMSFDDQFSFSHKTFLDDQKEVLVSILLTVKYCKL